MLSAPLRCLEVIIFSDTSKRCNKSKQTSLWNGSGAVPDLIPPNAYRLTVQEVRAWQRLMDSDWWTLKNLEPGYCSNWLSNGWSLIELLSALKAWSPHEQRLCFEISSPSDSYFDEKMKSFLHYKLAFVAFTLAKHWDRKVREQSKGEPRDRGWETEMSQMFWIQVKGRGESCESSYKTLEGVKRLLWFMDPFGW